MDSTVKKLERCKYIITRADHDENGYACISTLEALEIEVLLGHSIIALKQQVHLGTLTSEEINSMFDEKVVYVPKEEGDDGR